jgi:hypothetical protein
MIILDMTKVSFLSSNGHGQMVKINKHFNNFNKFQQFKQQKIWDCRDGHDHIFGLTILTMKIL